jgi:hypothetical protein
MGLGRGGSVGRKTNFKFWNSSLDPDHIILTPDLTVIERFAKGPPTPIAVHRVF